MARGCSSSSITSPTISCFCITGIHSGLRHCLLNRYADKQERSCINASRLVHALSTARFGQEQPLGGCQQVQKEGIGTDRWWGLVAVFLPSARGHGGRLGRGDNANGLQKIASEFLALLGDALTA